MKNLEKRFYAIIRQELKRSNKGTMPFNWENIWRWIIENFEPKS